jgi:putative protease
MIEYDAGNERLTLNVKNQFSVGDTIELMLPTGNQVFSLQAIEDNQGKAIERAAGSGHIVKIPVSLNDVSMLEHGYVIRHWSE